MRTFLNPILPGFCPDPSICRVGEDYYIVNSSFSYFPGVPIFHSKDLVHWEQIGNVLTRSSQLPLKNSEHSGGIFAPTIRYHEGTFYMITTNVSGVGNFYVTATNPEGPWSDPIVLDSEGIDPSLFFDDDGKVYYVGTRVKPEGRCRYYGDQEVFMRELDLDKGKLIGEEYILWDGALKSAEWAEGPHIYKINNYYYLLSAEGGTGEHHAIVIARSKTITGPYEGHYRNPILTHRHLGSKYPIAYTGHSDLVQTQNGEWWMILLASRPYSHPNDKSGIRHSNLGRETFLVPITWEDDWPVVNEGKGIVELEGIAPDLPEFYVVPKDHCNHFYGDELGHEWIALRESADTFCNLKERPGHLRMYLKPVTLKELDAPSFVGVRQQHKNFVANTFVNFTPSQIGESVGMVLIQSNAYHIRLECMQKENGNYICLTRCQDGKDELISEAPFQSENIYLKFVAKGQRLYVYYGTHPQDIRLLASEVDCSMLCTEVASGFVGNCIGLYASSNGKVTTNYADFDWFEYHGSWND